MSILSARSFRPIFYLVAILAVVAFWLPTIQPAHAQSLLDEDLPLRTQFGGQVFSDNLTVRDGEVYDGDVTVLTGNAVVKRGGRIDGNLNVLSGNVEVQEGGEVDGDISALSGNILIAGQVDGDVAAFSGNVDLAATAVIDGDVSIVTGSLNRAPGAQVRGDVVRGRGFPLPIPGSGENRDFSRPNPPSLAVRGPSFLGWLANLLLRVILAVILSAVIVTLVTLLHHLQPDILRPVYGVMVERTAFSFIVGLLVNLVLAILTAGLFTTLILCLGGVVTGVLLIGINLVGWAVVAQYVGQRLTRYLNTPIRPLTATLLGAIILTSLTTMLWALGGCFRFFGILFWLLVSSVGVGAAVVYWLKLDGRTTVPPPASPSVGTPAPVTPPVRAPMPGAPPSESLTSAPGVVNETASGEMLAPESAAPPPDADFTILRGVGPTFDRRLKAAGIRTFAQLAALTPEEIAAIIGWTPQRVIVDDLIGQAQRLSVQ
jgi:predicted flap endonuclease-1-like 5' DNA nuclease/cytoskeletal protein CcmA (bactofilin family)